MEGKQAHTNKDAFLMMIYVCELDPNHAFMIWNSRDGVTPFIVTCAYCRGHAKHVAWQSDIYMPNHQPPKGSLIFVDLDEDAARRSAAKFVDEMWNITAGEINLKRDFKTKHAAVEHFVAETMKGGSGQPHVKVVE